MFKETFELIETKVNSGYDRGIVNFMESLNVDLEKQAVIEEVGSFEVIEKALLENAGQNATSLEVTEDDYDEEKIDSMLTELKKEGI